MPGCEIHSLAYRAVFVRGRRRQLQLRHVFPRVLGKKGVP